MGINGINQQNYTYYNRGVNNNFTLANSYANTPVFTGNNQTVIGDSFNNKTVIPKDGKGDGSIGFWGALKNMTKGIGNFFKGMVCDENGKFSIGRTLTTLAMGAAIGAACAFLPTIAIADTTFSTLGLISAGFMGFAVLHAGKSAIDIMSAKTYAEAEQAWQGMGSALTEGGLAYLGYRASGGIFAKDVVPITPKGSTPKATPKAEPVVETEPIVTTPKAESVVEEPIVTAPKPEPVVEKPAMTMTDEARVQYNKTKSLLENTKHRVSVEAIDEQFATPKELAEMKEYYTELEKTVVEVPKAESIVEKPAMIMTDEAIAEVDALMPYNNVQHLSRNERLAYYDEQYSIHKNDPNVKNSVPMHGQIYSMNTQIRMALKNKENNSVIQYNDVLENIDVIDSFFGELSPTTHDVIGFRGRAPQGRKSTDIDFDIIENEKVGDIITPDKGYSYFAFENSVGEFTGGDKSLVYIARFPKNAKISRCTAHFDDGMGGEIVTPRGARYKLLAKTVDSQGNIKAYIEYIVEEPQKPAKINEELRQNWLNEI